MIYLTTDSDGVNTEGIGAMAQYQIICYVIAKLYSVGYYFTGFKNLTHYQHHNVSKSKWNSDINQFFNLPISQEVDYEIIDYGLTNGDLKSLASSNKNAIVYINPEYLLQFMDAHINDDQVKCICSELMHNLIPPTDVKSFSTDITNISYHIRRFTATDCCTSPIRELFDDTKKDYVINRLRTIDSLIDMPNRVYHVFSQGNNSYFNFLHDTGLNVKLHVNEYPTKSLYHMIHSDILVTANSSFSYIAHILGNHKMLFVRDTFKHRWKDDSIVVQ